MSCRAASRPGRLAYLPVGAHLGATALGSFAVEALGGPLWRVS
jgi:hypothetical protein